MTFQGHSTYSFQECDLELSHGLKCVYLKYMYKSSMFGCKWRISSLNQSNKKKYSILAHLWKDVVLVGIRDNWIQRLECSKVSFSSFFSASFSLQQIDFFHWAGNMGPEIDVSVTKGKRSPCSELCLGTLGKILTGTTWVQKQSV